MLVLEKIYGDIVIRLLRFVFIVCILTNTIFAKNLEFIEQNNNIWLQVYNNILKTQELDDEIKELEKQIKHAKGQKRSELRQLLNLESSKKKILNELPKSFDEMLEKVTLDNKIKDINIIEYLFTNQKNKFAIQTQKLDFLKKKYEEAFSYLNEELNRTKNQEIKNPKKEKQLKYAIGYFENAKGLIQGKEEVLKRKKELYSNALNEYGETIFVNHILNLAVVVLIFIVFYILKTIVSKRIENEEKLFKRKKFLNISFLIVMLFVIIIFNIGNIIYAATLIGVIAAGVTISMKEYVLSIASWFQLVFGNHIQIGDRVLVNVEGNPVIGEVIAISLFKVSLYESINNTTSSKIKIAGRIVFIPNNLFVNNCIFNYTHDKMKTVYDLVELSIPFGEDTKKIEDIVNDIAYELTERYMEVASKQFLSMKKRYDMRSRDFRPRIHLIPDPKEPFFILRIWYVTPYHQIMELKSQLSQRVVKKLLEEGVSFYKP